MGYAQRDGVRSKGWGSLTGMGYAQRDGVHAKNGGGGGGREGKGMGNEDIILAYKRPY